jgi:Arm DNA-binding domain
VPRRTLTDRGVAALAPRATSYAYPDPQMPGHYIRVRPSGAKSFVVITRDAGKQMWITIGKADLLSIDEARAQAREAVRCVRLGLPRTRPETAAKKFLSFVERGIEPACYLYRHYHPNGDLLYVGISLRALDRQISHSKTANWRKLIHRIEIEPFETREAALNAEQAAIRQEFPKFNTVHNNRQHPGREIARGLGGGANDEEIPPPISPLPEVFEPNGSR